MTTYLTTTHMSPIGFCSNAFFSTVIENESCFTGEAKIFTVPKDLNFAFFSRFYSDFPSGLVMTPSGFC